MKKNKDEQKTEEKADELGRSDNSGNPDNSDNSSKLGVMPVEPPETPTPPDPPTMYGVKPAEMPPNAHRKQPTRRYTKHPPGFWETLAREYLDTGLPRSVIAAKYGVNLASFSYNLLRLVGNEREKTRQAFLAASKSPVKKMVRKIQDKGKKWTQEAIARCYKMRERIDGQFDLLEDGKPHAKDVAYLSTAEERNDRVSRRNMGLEDKVSVNGALNVTGLVEVAVGVFEKKVRAGEDIVVDADFTLAGEGDEAGEAHVDDAAEDDADHSED